LSALLINIISSKAFGADYYQKNMWPKLGTLWLAGCGCFLLGIYLRKNPSIEKQVSRPALPTESKLALLEKVSKYEPRDHLLFVPVIYWGAIFFVIGFIYAGVSLWRRG
jgi:hypothetical protein